MLKLNQNGFFPYTPPTTLLYGLQEALRMLQEEGLPNIFRRHERYGEATRAAVRVWGLELVCEEPREYSSSCTAIFMPEGHDADRLRADHPGEFRHVTWGWTFKLAGKVFRVGHLGSFNDLMLAGTLGGIEWACDLPEYSPERRRHGGPKFSRFINQDIMRSGDSRAREMLVLLSRRLPSIHWQDRITSRNSPDLRFPCPH